MSGERIEPVHLKWSDFTSLFTVVDRDSKVTGRLTRLSIQWVDSEWPHSRDPSYGLVTIELGAYAFTFHVNDHKELYRGEAP